MILNVELSLSLEMSSSNVDEVQMILLLFSLFEFRLNVPMNIFQSCWDYM